MKHTVVTATDTGAVAILRGGINTDLVHVVAGAWLTTHFRPDSNEVARAVHVALGGRSRLRRYTIDRSQKGLVRVHFSSHKRPDVLLYRGFPCRFVDRHTATPSLTLVEVSTPITSTRGLKRLDTVPQEFVLQP